MDAFFAAVEEREHEWLQGKPIVVGADPKEGKGRGVVSTANYKAREYGIRSAMPISKAWELSEAARKKGRDPAVFLFADFHEYEKTSQRVVQILQEYSPTVEQASIDEAYFELPNDWEEAKRIAQAIKGAIKKEERLTSSIGIGPNKLIAKIASDFQKPDGLTIVPDDTKEAFLEPMNIRKLPGIGPKTETVLARMGVTTIRDLKGYTEFELTELMGKWGSDLYRKIRGIDDSELETSYEAKSIGEQETFEEDTRDPQLLIGTINEMAERIIAYMKRDGFAGFRTVAIIVRFQGFETKTRAHTLQETTDSLDMLKFEGVKLLMPFLDKRENPQNKKIRLIGLRIEKLQ